MTWRSAWSWNIDDTLNWQRGKHSMSFGTSLFFGNVWENSQTVVPGITFDMAADDPATALFTPANFPGASNAALNDAQDLFALLTGRVNSYRARPSSGRPSGLYELFGTRRRAGRMNESRLLRAGLVAHHADAHAERWCALGSADAVHAGQRHPLAVDARRCVRDLGNWCEWRLQLLQSERLRRQGARLRRVRNGHADYKTDWNNFAPNVGVAWRPNVQGGWLRTLLGDPEQATCARDTAVAYDRQGMGIFTSTVRRESWQHAEPDAAARPMDCSYPRVQVRHGPCCCGTRAACPPRGPALPASSMRGAFLRRRRIRFPCGRTGPTA